MNILMPYMIFEYPGRRFWAFFLREGAINWLWKKEGSPFYNFIAFLLKSFFEKFLWVVLLMCTGEGGRGRGVNQEPLRNSYEKNCFRFNFCILRKGNKFNFLKIILILWKWFSAYFHGFVWTLASMQTTVVLLFRKIEGFNFFISI